MLMLHGNGTYEPLWVLKASVAKIASFPVEIQEIFNRD